MRPCFGLALKVASLPDCRSSDGGRKIRERFQLRVDGRMLTGGLDIVLPNSLIQLTPKRVSFQCSAPNHSDPNQDS